MKKCKKLLSVLLAVVMMLSCMSVMGSAFQAYEDPGDYYYDSNDNPRAYLYTDEQRASILMDKLDNLLGGLGIKMKVAGINVDLTSFDALCKTLNNKLISAALKLGGHLADLKHAELDGKTRAGLGDVEAINTLLRTVGDNGTLIYNVINDGKLDLGTIGSLAKLDLSGVNVYLADLVSLIGGLLYGLQDTQLAIGSDPAYPNSALWDDITVADRNANWKLDTLIENIVLNLLTTPRKTVRITDRSQNTLGAQALEELQEDGTYNYYCYGINAAGELILEGDEVDKQYLTRWDENSALLKGASAQAFTNAFSLSEKSLYEMLEGMLAWAYDAFGGHNLDGQLRATLMQFCGALNIAVTDEGIQSQLKAIVDGYQAKEDESGSKQTLRNEFANTKGVAGNYNFMYIALAADGTVDTSANFNAKPDNLYYVVQWGQGYEYYHVTFPVESKFFAEIDWEYQAPMWADIMTTVGWTSGTSIIAHINDIVGTILDTALVKMNVEGGFTWTAGTTEGLGVANVTNLLKYVIETDTVKLFGSEFTLPANFASYDLEDALVMIAGVLLDKLMPALVLPENVGSVEEILVYAVREYMAEILPETGAEWDAAIAAATTEDDFLAIALNMGVSIGIYYLGNLIGLGTTTDGANNTSTADLSAYYGTSKTWEEKFNWLVDWIIDTYVPDLTKNTFASYPRTDDGLLDLSAIFSKLFPQVASILNCGDSTYAINLKLVYNVLRNALNGNFTSLANAVKRNSTGAGNKTAVAALAQVIQDLFGGLGLEKHANWSTIQGYFTTALASTTPIQALVGDYGTRTNLANLAKNVVVALGDSYTYFISDVLVFVAMLMKYESSLTHSVTTNGVETAYAGNATANIEYSFKLNVSGVRAYFNDGKYKSGTGSKDGTYSATVIDAKVYDNNGNQVATTGTLNTALGANQSTDISLSVAAPETPAVYTIVTSYRVKLPSQTTDASNEVIEHKQSFIITSQVNDAMVDTQYGAFSGTNGPSTATGSRSHKLDYTHIQSGRNTYISESQPLSTAEQTMFKVTDKFTETTNKQKQIHTWLKTYIDGFGFLVPDENTGIITVTANSDGTGGTPDHSGKYVITKDGQSVATNDAWFKWNVNNTAVASSGTNTPVTSTEAFSGSRPGEGTVEGQMWVTDRTNVRTDFKDDFTVYKITVQTTFEWNYGTARAIGGAKEDTTKAATHPTFDIYINLYNSYNLAGVLDGAMGRAAEDYNLTSPEAQAAWAEYNAAMDNAMNQLYGTWVGATFKADHTTTEAYNYVDDKGAAQTIPAGSSTFQVAAIKLQKAVDALDKYILKESTSSAGEVVVSSPAEADNMYHAVYQLLQAQKDKKLNNQDWVLYRWYEYWDDYKVIDAAINVLTPPSQTVNSTVVGLEGTGDELDAAIATISDADVKALVEGLKVAPKAEAIQAAKDAYKAYADMYPEHVANHDVADLLSQAQQMAIDGSAYTGDATKGRLLPKFGTYNAVVNEYYFLKKAIDDYGSEAAAKYSAESYANYAKALADAQTVLAKAQANSTSQSEIHMARYEFLKAYKALIAADKAVDVSALEATYATAKDILDKMNTAEAYAVKDGVNATEAYTKLLLALGYPVTYAADGAKEASTYYVGGEYTAEYALSQKGLVTEVKKGNWVGEIDANLKAAMANFVLESALPELTPVDGSTGAIGDVTEVDGVTTGYIYGVKAGTSADEYFKLVDESAGTVVWTASTLSTAGTVNGTGAVATVKDTNGNTVAVYTLVVFGDVNGDGEIKGADLNDVNLCLLAGTTDAFNEVQVFAADVTGDGEIKAADKNDINLCLTSGSNDSITVNPYLVG